MTQSQKRGYVALAVVMIFSLVILMLVQQRQAHQEAKPKEVKRTQQFTKEVMALEEELQHRQMEKQQNHRRPRQFVRYQAEKSPVAYQSDSGSEPIDYQVAPRKEALVFDLNSADTMDLQQLRGIGPVFARRIVNYRSLLGGYVRKEQLLEVYGMKPELYQTIAPYLTVDSVEVVRLNLNTATLNQLKRHPYITYHQAKAIVQYRSKVGLFNTPDDLLKVNLIDENTYNRIIPYIE